jgi:hypothetical protein
VHPPGAVHKFQTIGCHVHGMWALCAAGAGLSLFIKQCTSFQEFRFDLFVQKIQKGLILHMSLVRAAKGRTTWTMDGQSH